jgi:hypothetical protein
MDYTRKYAYYMAAKPASLADVLPVCLQRDQHTETTMDLKRQTAIIHGNLAHFLPIRRVLAAL